MATDTKDARLQQAEQQEQQRGPKIVAATPEVILETYGLTPVEYAILKSTICLGAPAAMVGFFLAASKRYRMDPFRRQIYLVKTKSYNDDTKQYEDTFVIVTGIDGLRAVAERSNEYEGQEPPIWEYNEDGSLKVCTVAVHRAGKKFPFYGIADFKEFCLTKNDGSPRASWKRMPKHMLRVRAEAMALRMAFPEDLGGLYAEEEIDGRQPEPPITSDLKAIEAAIETGGDPAVEEAQKVAASLGWPRAKFLLELQRLENDGEALLRVLDEEKKNQSPHPRSARKPKKAEEAPTKEPEPINTYRGPGDAEAFKPAIGARTGVPAVANVPAQGELLDGNGAPA